MSEEVRTTSSTGGEKGTKLARYDLVPVGPLRQVAEHYGKGAAKYADHNWRRGYEWSKTYAALMRHVTQWWDGEDIDEETGSHHLAAVAFHALAGLEFAERFPEFDDRFKPPTDEDEGDGSVFIAPLAPETWGQALSHALTDREEALAWDGEHPGDPASEWSIECADDRLAEAVKMVAEHGPDHPYEQRPPKPLGEGWVEVGFLDEAWNATRDVLSDLLDARRIVLDVWDAPAVRARFSAGPPAETTDRYTPVSADQDRFIGPDLLPKRRPIKDTPQA